MPDTHLPNAKSGMVLSEICTVAMDSFRLNKVRFALTAFGMVIGTASLILVVTIGLTGKNYVLSQIEAIGVNMITAEYGGGANGTVSAVQQDYLTIDDMHAVVEQVPGIRSASPMIELQERIPIGGGKERDIHVLGVGAQYRWIRTLDLPAGRFFDEQDEQSRAKVAALTGKLAGRPYGRHAAAPMATRKLRGPRLIRI